MFGGRYLRVEVEDLYLEVAEKSADLDGVPRPPDLQPTQPTCLCKKPNKHGLSTDLGDLVLIFL